MRAADGTQIIAQLEHAGYILVGGTSILITPTGHDVRDAIEGETDRVFFAPWPAIDAAWVRDWLAVITAQLSR